MTYFVLALYLLIANADYRDSRRLKMKRLPAFIYAVLWPAGFVLTAYLALMATLRRAL